MPSLFYLEGCGFVKYSHREMALAAINALNGCYTMRVGVNISEKKNFTFVCLLRWQKLYYEFFGGASQGCDQPLTVRFADPKRPKPTDSRFLYFLSSFFSLYFL